MTEEPAFDPSRVMLNGAAIALVASLTDGMEKRLREEIKGSERRLMDVIEAQGQDIDGLEEWRGEELRKRQRREGQWSVFRTGWEFVARHDRVILAAAVLMAPILASVFGVRIEIGS